jgi:RNA polymerase sigma-70 factor (ECF subfamily)
VDDAIDRRILERARAGSAEAFRELVERHQDRVFRLMRRLLRCDRDTAADFAQEVFLRVHRGLARFDGRAKFTTWLHKIAVNVSISDHRRRSAQKRGRWTFSLDAPMPGTDDLRAEPAADDPDPAARAYHQEIAAAVRAAMDELPDEFRQAVVLRDLQGLSYEEIGSILGVPVGTVRSRIHRGRLVLQEKLRDYRP